MLVVMMMLLLWCGVDGGCGGGDSGSGGVGVVWC